MRYQSTTRASSTQRGGGGARVGVGGRGPSSQNNGEGRPRAISVSRIVRSSSGMMIPGAAPPPPPQQAEDPTEVARQILDLREKREASQHNHHHAKQRHSSPLMMRLPLVRTNNHDNNNNGGGVVVSSSPKVGRVVLRNNNVGSNNNNNNVVLVEEEVQAEHRLKNAEHKISGLLEELEELKFFQELESEKPAPTTPRTPRTTTTTALPPPPPPKTPSSQRGGGGGGVGIPVTIRASSPAKGRLLPPPPPNQNNNNNGGGSGRGDTSSSSYKPMSPRSIAKLDRNSLELECQTLVRKMQVVQQERNSQAAMIEMYEISLQENDMDKARIKRLEGELTKVSGELRKQLMNIQKGKESLVKDYEAKLQQNLSKLHRTQEKADSYKMDLEIANADADKWKHDMEKQSIKWKDDKTRAGDLKAREAVLELQLAEARNLNATLVKKVEKKRNEVISLKEDASQICKILESKKEEKDEAYETRIAALEKQLSLTKEQHDNLEEEFLDRETEMLTKNSELDAAKAKDAEQSTFIEELQRRVEELEEQVDARFEEGKKTAKSQETKKMQEFVSERATLTRDYEQRIKALQEQLKHQSDRHHSEISENRKRNDERLEAMREDVKNELRIQEGDKVMKLEYELSTLKRNYEQEKLEFQTRLQEAQQKSREAVSDFKRQDEIRHQELDHMHDRLQSYVMEAGDKNDKLSELQDCLEQERKKNIEATEELTAQIDEAHNKLVEAQAAAKESTVMKERMSDLQATFDNLQKESQKDKAHHEEVESDLRMDLAMLEGSLRASESTVKSKGSRIQELEEELDIATATSSKVGEDSKYQIESLRAQLTETVTEFESQRSSVLEKDAAVTQLQREVNTLQDKLKAMSQLGDAVKDMKKRTETIEYENTQKDAEITQAMKLYEETRSKLLDAEQRYTMVKADVDSQLDKKEKLVERYDKTVQDLQFKLDKEKSSNDELQSSAQDLQRSVNVLKTEKVRKETELTNLRKDYQDLSSLLEENLHSSAKKDDLDLELKRKQREMRETVGIYNEQIAEVETKFEQEKRTNNTLQSQISQLQASLERLEDQKIKLSTDVTQFREKYQDAHSQLEAFKQEHELSKGGVEAELGRKERQIREAVQRYTKTIAELESKLEEEGQSKIELEDRLASARSELEGKQKQTQELIQRHMKTTMNLESDLRSGTVEKEQLKIQLDQTTRDLEQKRKELVNIMSKYNSEFAGVKQEHNEFREMSQSTREELERKEQQIGEMKNKIPELLAELEAKTRERDEYKNSSKRFESELNKRKEQLNDAVARYTNQIADLEAQLDEQSVARSSTQDRVETVKAEANRKNEKIRDLKRTVTDLESKLEIANKSTDAAIQKVDGISRDLDEKESEVRKFEMEKIEIETKLHTHSRAKDELRSKVSELSSKLERKERELREVSDRHNMYIMELESKLDRDTDAKHELQLQIDKLKSNLNSAAEVSTEASDLREKVYTLERSVETYRGKARDAEAKSKSKVTALEDKLESATQAKEETEITLKKVTGEKAEVIAALEGVINEVQNREDEIESLSELLHRRDEELQHAKIIATKALQSAKDIQKRYKEKDNDRHSGMLEIDELNDRVEMLTSQNETLQRKISMLERDLRDRNLECKRLKDQLRQVDGKQLRDNEYGRAKDDGSAFSATQATFCSSRTFSNGASSGSVGGVGMRIDTSAINGEMGMDTDSFSPVTSPISPADDYRGDNMFEKEVDYPAFEKQTSIDSDDAGSSTINTHDSESRNGFESVSSGRSRRSIERDALRKYVRQRYMSKRVDP